MRVRFRKILLGILGVDLLAKEFVKSMNRCKRYFRQRMWAWAMRLCILLLLLGLAQGALLFGLVALALYLNGWLESQYLGFLAVSLGCLSLLLFIGLLNRFR